DSALKLRWSALPRLAPWGLAFLRNANAKKYRQQTIANLKLAQYSLDQMRALLADDSIGYRKDSVGSLRLFRKPEMLVDAAQTASELSRYGLTFRTLTAIETSRLEP